MENNTVNLIVDGSNIEHRMFWISKKTGLRQNEEGENTGCIYTFLLAFKNIVKTLKPDNIYVCWDKKLTWPSKNFRHELTKDQYKGTREKPVDIHEMYEQEPKIIDILKSLGCKCIFPNVMEGDDIISWLSHTLQGTNIIVSVDGDMCQLVNENTSIFRPDSKKRITVDNFEQEIGVKREHFKLYKAIMGDNSDNIEGLAGYGKVKSKKLAENWNNCGATEEQKLIVENNLKVLDLDIGYKYYPEEVPCYQKQLDEQKDKTCCIKEFQKSCERYQLFNLSRNISEWYDAFASNRIANLINSLV